MDKMPVNNELLPVSILGISSSVKIATKMDDIVTAPSYHTNGRVFYHNEEEELVYRDSSVPTSRFSSNPGDTRSGNPLVGSQTGNSNSNSPSRHAQEAISESDEVDDQQSTEPVPADFDHRALFQLSPPLCERQDAPVTRARARAQAQAQARAQALVIPNQTKSNASADPGPMPETVKPETSNDGNQSPPTSICQAPPVILAKREDRAQCIDGPDGSMEGRNSAGDENSAESAVNTQCRASHSVDDEYELPETDNDNQDSEASVIKDIRAASKKTKEKPFKSSYPSRLGDKHTARAKADPTKIKTSGQAKNGISIPTRKHHIAQDRALRPLDEEDFPTKGLGSIRQYTKAYPNSNGPGNLNSTLASQDFASKPQILASPFNSKPRAPNIRRPKRPFYSDELRERRVKVKPATSTYAIASTRQKSPSHQEQANSSPFKKPSPRLEKTFEATDVPQPEAKPHTGDGTARSMIDEYEDCAIDHNMPAPVNSGNVHTSPITSSFSQYPLCSNIEHTEMQTRNPFSYQNDAKIGKQASDFELSDRRAKKLNGDPVVEEPINNVDIHRRDRLLPSSAGSVGFERAAKTKNDATQTEFLFQSPLRDSYCRKGPKREGIGKGTTRYKFMGLPGVHDAAGFREDRMKADHILSTKSPTSLSNTEESLHPNSRLWAQMITEKPRRKNLGPVFPTTEAATGPQRWTPKKAQGNHKDSNSRREIAPGGHHKAISKSIHEITTAVLWRLQSKESSIEDVVATYQRGGHTLINMLTRRQSIELRQAASTFDSKCVQLEGLFAESARHLKTINKRASGEDSQHVKDWTRGRNELEKAIKTARDAIASI